MKPLFLVSLIGGGILLALGSWFVLSRQAVAEPTVFENDPLALKRSLDLETPTPVPIEAEPDPQGAVSPSPPTPTTTTPEIVSELTPPSVAPDKASPTAGVTIVDRLIRFGFRTPPTERAINTIVLHSSYNASGGDTYNLDKIIGQYEQYGVGAHFLIDRSGTIYRLVRESDIAYHAGESKMPDGRKNVNDFSIGIELMGTEESGFTGKQYDAVNALIADIEARHPIKEVVGHGDVAPTRKSDPWKFDWKKLK